MPGLVPARPGPGREGTAPLGERDRGCQRLAFEEPGDLFGQRERGVGVVGDLERGERVGPAHDAEPDLAGGSGSLLDRRQWVTIGIDDVIEEPRGLVDDTAESIPVDRAVLHEATEIDAPEVASLEGEQWDLTTRIGRLDRTEVMRGVLRVDAIDEDHPRIADGHAALAIASRTRAASSDPVTAPVRGLIS